MSTPVSISETRLSVYLKFDNGARLRVHDELVYAKKGRQTESVKGLLIPEIYETTWARGGVRAG